MYLTKLKKEEKIRSLVYVTKNEISSNEIIEKKQFEILEIFWKYYIKECDYSYIARVLNHDGNCIYTFDWPEKMDLTNLDRLLCEFVYRTESYLQIHKVLHNEINKCRPTLSQQKFVENFIKYYEDWWTYDSEYFLNVYNNSFQLDEFIKYKDYVY